MGLKRNGKIIMSCFMTVYLLVMSLQYLDHLMMRKDIIKKFHEFYEHEENFDVLFLGSSHVRDAVSPVDLWEEYGIVSYNLATPGCRIPSDYWVLKSALEYTSPQLIVLDCAYLFEEKVRQESVYNHWIFDAMPLDQVKIEAVCDLYDDFDDRLSFICPFAWYHGRWSELEKDDFEKQYGIGRMGFKPLTSIKEITWPELVAETVQEVDNVSTLYLEKIIMECQNRGLDILLTFLPFDENEESQNHASYIYEIAKKYNIHYLAPDILAQILNPKTDFANNEKNNSHLNISGAHKVSFYLGDYIMKNYDISDQRGNLQYAFWHTYYEQYVKDKISLFKSQETLDSYMLMAADRNYNVIININNSDFWENERYVNLLGNLGVDIDGISDDTDFIVVKGDERKADCYENLLGLTEQVDTAIGDIRIKNEADTTTGSAYKVYLDDNMLYDVPLEESIGDDVRIYLIDKNTMEIVDDKRFFLQ